MALSEVNEMLAFKPITEKSRHLKIVAYGPPGSGKSHFGLTFSEIGRLAAIDTEARLVAFQSVFHFDALDATGVDAIMPHLRALYEDRGQTYATLLVDSLTIPWRRIVPARPLTKADWRLIKATWNQMLGALACLPQHVVLTAHEHEDPDSKAISPDAEKDLFYWADLVLHFQPDHKARVEKSMPDLPPMGSVITPSAALLIPASVAQKSA